MHQAPARPPNQHGAEHDVRRREGKVGWPYLAPAGALLRHRFLASQVRLKCHYNQDLRVMVIDKHTSFRRCVLQSLHRTYISCTDS